MDSNPIKIHDQIKMSITFILDLNNLKGKHYLYNMNTFM